MEGGKEQAIFFVELSNIYIYSIFGCVGQVNKSLLFYKMKVETVKVRRIDIFSFSKTCRN